MVNFIRVNSEVIDPYTPYKCWFNWSQPGETYILCQVVVDGRSLENELFVVVNSLTPPTPSAFFSIIKQCGQTTIIMYDLPEGINYDCYWQTTSNGTSTTRKANSDSPLVITNPETLYLRAKSTVSPYNWSLQSQFIGNIEITTNVPDAPSSPINGYIIGEGHVRLSVSSRTRSNSI